MRNQIGHTWNIWLNFNDLHIPNEENFDSMQKTSRWPYIIMQTAITKKRYHNPQEEKMRIGPKLKNQIHVLVKHQESLMREWMAKIWWILWLIKGLDYLDWLDWSEGKDP